MLLKINSNTPPAASLLVLEHLKGSVNVQVEAAKGNLLQPSKVRAEGEGAKGERVGAGLDDVVRR